MAGIIKEIDPTYDLAVLHDYAPAKAPAMLPYAGKRSFDFVVALLGLALTAPLLFVLSILVRLTSRGPAFFRQTRVSTNGKEFKIFKFRTMRCSATDDQHREYAKAFIEGNLAAAFKDSNGNGVYKLINDHRVTWLGRWLRRTSLDELPQLINVLKGEMSMVGPRPHTLYEVDCYQNWHLARLKGTPGLTGWWQVSGRSAVKFDESVEMDLWYLEHQPFWLDVRILGMTLVCVFRGSGAY